jgi:hypothetical protein
LKNVQAFLYRKIKTFQLCQQQRAEEELRFEHKKVKAECELLKRENSMYEQKCVDMDRDRQQMYLVMFRKGQQAANQAVSIEQNINPIGNLGLCIRYSPIFSSFLQSLVGQS